MRIAATLLLSVSSLCAESFPQDTQLTPVAMPALPMPAYLMPTLDPAFGTQTTRVSDQAAMDSQQQVIGHHYSKTQPWNADGSLISLSGWPAAILDGQTYEFLRWIMPPGEHHTWSNTDPAVIYGIQQPNSFVRVDATTGIATTIDGSTRAIVAVRLDSGLRTTLLQDDQMSWYIHVSCRNLQRQGWAYLTEFADPHTQPEKATYQLAFAVRIDDSGAVERFAHVHHSATVAHDRSPFGVPNRDGSRMMFRSDWEDGSGPVYSYIAEMPRPLGDGSTGMLEHTEQ